MCCASVCVCVCVCGWRREPPALDCNEKSVGAEAGEVLSSDSSATRGDMLN